METINFTSVNNGEQIGIRLKWEDPLADQSQVRTEIFRDQVAVQFALGEMTLHSHGHNEPFWGMGNRGKPVNIWHWQAGLEQAIKLAETKTDEQFSRKTDDSFGDVRNPEQYMGGGMDVDALVFGGASPIVQLNQMRDSPVTELNAEGFGTLTPQPDENQNVIGKGEWKDGVWTVVFLRDLFSTGKWDVSLFERKGPALLALAVWDGLKEDRNGRKVVSVWQRLNILKSQP